MRESTTLCSTGHKYFDRYRIDPFWTVKGSDRLLKTRRQAIIGRTRQGRPVRAAYFPGKTDRRALVIAGVHGSELSGVESANLLLRDLTNANRPRFTTIVVPCLFPDNAANAEQALRASGSLRDRYIGRRTHPDRGHMRKGRSGDPNRAFPPVGHAIDPSKPVDALGMLIEPENVMLIDLIDRFRPERIVSLHAMSIGRSRRITARDRGRALPGIFADPHGTLPHTKSKEAAEAIKRGQDDAHLALSMARVARAAGARVPGNWLDSAEPLTEYAIPTAKFTGVSLGRWVSHPVREEGPRDRPSITIVTVEIQHYTPSWAERTIADRRTRLHELQAYARAIEVVFLGATQ